MSQNIFVYNNSCSVMLRALTERLYFVKGKDGFVPCPKPTRSFAELRGFLLALVRAYPGEATVWTNE
jgi:hypothetical protein